MTLWDETRGEPFVAALTHRFGSSRSGPVDNWHAGGICASVDVKTSMLGQAAMLSPDKKLTWHVSHPDTEERIE